MSLSHHLLQVGGGGGEGTCGLGRSEAREVTAGQCGLIGQGQEGVPAGGMTVGGAGEGGKRIHVATTEMEAGARKIKRLIYTKATDINCFFLCFRSRFTRKAHFIAKNNAGGLFRLQFHVCQ